MSHQDLELMDHVNNMIKETHKSYKDAKKNKKLQAVHQPDIDWAKSELKEAKEEGDKFKIHFWKEKLKNAKNRQKNVYRCYKRWRDQLKTIRTRMYLKNGTVQSTIKNTLGIHLSNDLFNCVESMLRPENHNLFDDFADEISDEINTIWCDWNEAFEFQNSKEYGLI
jgi:hypothetical protein